MAQKNNPGYNPRYKNGNLRRKYRARLKAQGGPCGICKGRLGEIHYDEPSDWKHPLSFVVDEIIPVSRWKEYGYSSPEAVAQDYNNLQAAHWCCNQAKGNKIIVGKKITVDIPHGAEKRNISSEGRANNNIYSKEQIIAKVNISDGAW